MNIPSEMDDLLKQLENMGCTLSLSIKFPPFPPTHLPAHLPEPLPVTQKATIRTTLWALNKLVAAPGQPNRELVRKFLYVRGWIGPTEEPEAWNLDHVPVSKEELIKLAGELAQFDQDRHQPAPPA